MSMERLTESKDLYKGIFWIVDFQNIYNNRKYCFTIPCNQDGVSQFETDDEFVMAKSGDTYNHKKYWSMLPKSLTFNRPFDYYPRGRVEIANGKATVYLNPNIADEETLEFIKEQFNLNSHNGIKKVRMFPDYSEHYKCFLDW